MVKISIAKKNKPHIESCGACVRVTYLPLCSDSCKRKKKEPGFLLTLLCSRYLSSRAVTRQVLSAHMSLTSVFGMGTGGPSWQSKPTIAMVIHHLIYVKSRLASNSKEIIAPSFSVVKKKLVTRTGFEPMLTAWEAAVLTTWPTGHWCTFTDSNRGPTD